MGGIVDSISNFFREFLQGWILSNLSTMFVDVNNKVGTISTDVAKGPQEWNSSIFTLVHSLSENVMVPIGGLIISFVLIYELCSMLMEKNNLHDFDTSIFVRFIIKSCIAVMLLSNTFEIAMAVFDVASSMIAKASAQISSATGINAEQSLMLLYTQKLSTLSVGELFGLGMEAMLVSQAMKIMSVIITVILYGRMIEIYLFISVAPVPAATVTNKEWGNIGTNYFKGLVALAFQGFFIVLCVGIYAVLISNLTMSDNLHSALWSVAVYTVVLCFSLFKTGAISKSIMHAH